MNPVFETLQRRYQELLARTGGPSPGEEVWESVRLFLEDARRAGSVLTDPGERALLRAYMRFLAVLLHEHGETPPPVELLPPEQGRWVESPPSRSAKGNLPVWFWGLVSAAVVAVIAGLITVVMGAGGHLFPPPTVPLATVPPTATATVVLLPAATPTSSPPPLPTPTASPTPLTPPLFSNLTIALGVLPTGEPLLVGNEFDWNTRAVYAIFDYAGMRKGLPWSAAWTRNGREIARQNHLWDGASGGTAWVVYFNPDGTVLFGGNYTVSLYIEDRLQAEASFRIRYYVPRTPTP